MASLILQLTLQKIHQENRFFFSNFIQKQKSATSYGEQSVILQKLKQNYKQMQVSQKRPFRKIQYSSQARKDNINKKKGTHQETTSLNINLKTVTKGYLLQLIATNQQPQTHDIIYQYIQDKANFTSTRKLFGANNQSNKDEASYAFIRDFMLGIYQNTDFVKKILSNQKMDFKTKLLFVKFLERIRKSAFVPAEHKLWKERL